MDSGREMVLELLVVGPAFLEAFMPAGVVPESGLEKYVPSIPVGLGGALNSASVAAALGSHTAFMYPRTSWVLDGAVEECCRRTGIRGLPWGGPSEPFVTLVWTGLADRAFISSADWSPFRSCPAFPVARRVHVGGLAECALLSARISAAAAGGARISTCAGWNPPVLESLKDGTGYPLDLLFMNEIEAACAAGSVRHALEILPGRAARDVVVTLGADGAEAVFGGRYYRAVAPRVDVVDPTGAGDAFAAAFVAGLLKAERDGVRPDVGSILADSCRVASSVVGMLGGVVIDPAHVTSR